MKPSPSLALLFLLAPLVVGSAPATGQPPVQEFESVAERPIQDELREVREGLMAAIEVADVEAILGYLDDDIVVIWPNGDTSRRHEGVRQTLEAKLTGPKAKVRRHTLHVEAGEQSLLPEADTAIAFGSLNSHLVMASGSEFDAPGAWSATLIKRDGRWRIVSLHASTGLFENPLVERAENNAAWGGVIAGAMGALVGAIATRLLARARSTRSKR